MVHLDGLQYSDDAVPYCDAVWYHNSILNHHIVPHHYAIQYQDVSGRYKLLFTLTNCQRWNPIPNPLTTTPTSPTPTPPTPQAATPHHSSLRLTLLYPALLPRYGIPIPDSMYFKSSTCRTALSSNHTARCRCILYFSLAIELLFLKHSTGSNIYLGSILSLFFYGFQVDHIIRLYS